MLGGISSRLCGKREKKNPTRTGRFDGLGFIIYLPALNERSDTDVQVSKQRKGFEQNPQTVASQSLKNV